MNIYIIIILIRHLFHHFIHNTRKEILTAVELRNQHLLFIWVNVLFIHEQDDVNLIKSGREWFQEISDIHIDLI